MTNFLLGKHSPQGEGKPGLAQKEVDGCTVGFIRAVVFQGENELTIRLPFGLDRHGVR